MEKRVNNLIMSVNDHIDEIEIRLQQNNSIVSPKNLNEIKVCQPELHRKQAPVRASSTDFRVTHQNPQ